MSLPYPATGTLLTVLVILAAICDIRWRRIPNWLTLPGLVLGTGLS